MADEERQADPLYRIAIALEALPLALARIADPERRPSALIEGIKTIRAEADEQGRVKRAERRAKITLGLAAMGAVGGTASIIAQLA